MRWLIVCTLLFTAVVSDAGAGAVRRAAANDGLFESAGIDLAQVKMRLPCYASTTRVPLYAWLVAQGVPSREPLPWIQEPKGLYSLD